MTHNDDQDDSTPRERVITNSEHDLPQRVTKLEDRHDEQRLDVASLLASRRSWRWIMALGVPPLLGALVVVMLWAVDRSSVSAGRTGKAEATMDSLQKEVDLLRGYVHELQRNAGLNGGSISSGRVGVNP